MDTGRPHMAAIANPKLLLLFHTFLFISISIYFPLFSSLEGRDGWLDKWMDVWMDGCSSLTNKVECGGGGGGGGGGGRGWREPLKWKMADVQVSRGGVYLLVDAPGRGWRVGEGERRWRVVFIFKTRQERALLSARHASTTKTEAGNTHTPPPNPVTRVTQATQSAQSTTPSSSWRWPTTRCSCRQRLNNGRIGGKLISC